MDHAPEKEKTFHVKVGAAECIVTGETEAEAVEKMLSRFRQQMPQMGTAIPGINIDEFQIHRVR